ncbi:MAG: hypothetical protein Q4D06_10095 [Coriobacteriia bacterium]|nr:hypothetical protein [Coriobacteriia bacterium]
MIQLGTIVDGRELYYDASLYEFRVARNVVTYQEVQELDRHAHVNWLAPEQKDWFRRINPVDLDRCNRRALDRHGNGYEGLSPEEQVQADAKRNDSILAGKIVDADPALVQAVIAEMEKQGVFAQAAVDAGAQAVNPLATMELPRGMEELSQLAKHEKRQMTPLEGILMRRILKNSDKAKLKREKEAAKAIDEAEKQLEAEEQELKENHNIAKAQKAAAKREERRHEAEMKGESSTEERALAEMRRRNKAKSEALDKETTYVPGMEKKPRGFKLPFGPNARDAAGAKKQ